ncbi:MAG: NYN domain-containing protein [Chloroflexota bacterium]
MSENQKLFALLIDGDNAQPTLIPEIINAVNEYGKPIIKKIYGDWSQEQLKSWKPLASKYNIDIEHHYNVSSGKNATDIALVIDAMDILQQKGDKLYGFCIVSSDSDFTQLARRIRNEGLTVIGIGKPHSQTLVEAYDDFISTESLQSQNSQLAVEEKGQPIEEISDDAFLKLFIRAHKQVIKQGIQDNQGRATLREVREAMKALGSEFSSEYQKMPNFVHKVKMLAEAHPDRIALEEQPDSKPIIHYVHIKPTKVKSVHNEVQKFRDAYKHAAEILKLKDKAGWVSLSAIGNALRELYPDYERYVYGGVKYGQLKEVIEKMNVDYPKVIELNPNSQVSQMRFKK